MEIPLEAQVECTDGVYGRSVYVLISPVTGKVIHLVVRKAAFPHTEFILPMNLVSETIAGTIQLCCSSSDLEKLPPFLKTRFIESKISPYAMNRGYGMGTFYYWPYVSLEGEVQVPVEEQQIPLGEIAVQRGTRVEATDGYIGHVDEFVVDAENDRITHLVMREGHLWGKKDVIIPLSALRSADDDTVFLKLDKQQIESLPTFPVHRHWA